MNNFYKEKIAFDIMFGSILKEDETDNLFYNCRKMDKSFYLPKGFDKAKLADLMRKSITDRHDYVYDMVKDTPATHDVLGFIY